MKSTVIHCSLKDFADCRGVDRNKVAQLRQKPAKLRGGLSSIRSCTQKQENKWHLTSLAALKHVSVYISFVSVNSPWIEVDTCFPSLPELLPRTETKISTLFQLNTIAEVYNPHERNKSFSKNSIKILYSVLY